MFVSPLGENMTLSLKKNENESMLGIGSHIGDMILTCVGTNFTFKRPSHGQLTHFHHGIKEFTSGVN